MKKLKYLILPFLLLVISVQMIKAEEVVVDTLTEAEWTDVVGDRAYFRELDEKKLAVKNDFSGFNFPTGFKEGVTFIVLLCLGLVVFYIVKGMQVGVKSKEPKVRFASLKEAEEGFEDADFQHLIEKFESEGAFRLALRAWYLHILQLLQGADLISWHISKTNETYLYELPIEYQEDFKSLNIYFDKYWYGHVPLVDKDYFLIKERLVSFSVQFEKETSLEDEIS